MVSDGILDIHNVENCTEVLRAQLTGVEIKINAKIEQRHIESVKTALSVDKVPSSTEYDHIIARPGVDAVIIRTAIYSIVASSSVDEIIAIIAVDHIVTIISCNTIAKVTCLDDIISTSSPNEVMLRGLGLTINVIVSLPTIHILKVWSGDDDIIAIATVEATKEQPPFQRVFTITAVNDILAVETIARVIAIASLDIVRAIIEKTTAAGMNAIVTTATKD